MFLPVSRVPRWLPPALLALAMFGAERALAQSVDGAEDRAVVARRMADALINAPEVLTAPHPDVVDFTLCPACEARITEAVAALRDGRKPDVSTTGGYGPDGVGT